MKRSIFVLPLVAVLIAGCDKVPTATVQALLGTENLHRTKCVTTGPNSPIVTGSNSEVVINGKVYAPGQSADCPPESNSISTHGANSPIIIGAGSKVIIHTDR